MKKVLIILAAIFGFIILALLILPFLFKDRIKAEVDKALVEYIDADVVWEDDGFSLSFLSNFPNPTVTLEKFGIVNREPFEGEVLFAVDELEVEVGLFSLMGEQIKIKNIELDQPFINIQVSADGTANYDIAVEQEEDTTEVSADTVSADFNIAIDGWEINDGHVVYNDETIPFRLELKNLQHSGSGDFTQDVFDFNTSSTADTVSVVFDGTEYVSNKFIELEAILEISDEYSRYTFKDNHLKVNEFEMNFEGFLALLDDGSMDMDIRYGTSENTFKSLLSLVPGIYSKDFEDIEAEGNLMFKGNVKGKYDSLTLPAFDLALKVNDAMFKYPDVPEAVSDIKMDLLVNNKDGKIENTQINLSEFHMSLGKNPVDASVLIKNLRDYDMDAAVKGSIDLADLSSMFPMEGLSMKGNFNLDLKANGIYDSVKQIIPAIDVNAVLKNGYVKSSEFPYAIEDINFEALVKDPSGNMNDFNAVVNNFRMVVDGEPFEAALKLQDLEDYTWDLKAKGGIDLEKMTKVFPQEGMTLAGIINADFTTAGKMSDLEAGRYGRLPARGTLTVRNFKYTDKELPYDVTVSAAKVTFDPRQLTLNNYKGKVGKSDMSMNGSLQNYVGYILDDKEMLSGTLNFRSDLLDLNEFMTEEEGPEIEEEESEGFGVIKVPENIDFVLHSEITKVKLMDMEMTGAKGDIIVRDGVANLSGLRFGLLGGQFAVSGSYDTRDIKKPAYDLKLGVNNLAIQKAFETFTLVQKFAPVAQLVNGNVSSDINISGLLNQNLMPVLNSTSGSGLLKIAQGTMKDSKILNSLSSITKLDNLQQVRLKDVSMDFNINEGKLGVKPFDVNLGGFTTTVEGTTSLDGSIDYALQMDLPAGNLGSQLNKVLGEEADKEGTIPVTIGIGGTYDNPQPKLLSSEQAKQVKSAVKEKVEEQARNAAGNVLDQVKDEKAKDIIGNILGDKKDSTKSDTTTTGEEDVKEKVQEEAKEKIRNLFKKKD